MFLSSRAANAGQHGPAPAALSNGQGRGGRS